MSDISELRFRHVAAAIMVLLSIWDYYDHLSRPDDRFLQIWPQWLLFTALSTGFVIAIFLLAAGLLRRTALPTLLGEAVAFGCAIVCHLLVSGKIAAWVAQVGPNLRFDAPIVPALAASGIYLLIGIAWIGARKALFIRRRGR